MLAIASEKHNTVGQAASSNLEMPHTFTQSPSNDGKEPGPIIPNGFQRPPMSPSGTQSSHESDMEVHGRDEFRQVQARDAFEKMPDKYKQPSQRSTTTLAKDGLRENFEEDSLMEDLVNARLCRKLADDIIEPFEEVGEDTAEVIVEGDWVRVHSHGNTNRNGGKTLAEKKASEAYTTAAAAYETAQHVYKETQKVMRTVAHHRATKMAVDFAAKQGISVFQLVKKAMSQQVQASAPHEV
jgi:hypothetical protein